MTLDGSIIYTPGMHDVMNGYTGNILLTNGQLERELNMPGGIVRFRILNGSNSTLMHVRF